MKKILFVFLLMFGVCLSSNAERGWFKAHAYKKASVLCGEYTWGNRVDCNFKICIDDNGKSNSSITIYTPKVQRYKIYGYYNDCKPYVDVLGGQSIKMYISKPNGECGEMRIRYNSRGNLELYIEFDNLAWVYGITKVE